MLESELGPRLGKASSRLSRTLPTTDHAAASKRSIPPQGTGPIGFVAKDWAFAGSATKEERPPFGQRDDPIGFGLWEDEEAQAETHEPPVLPSSLLLC